MTSYKGAKLILFIGDDIVVLRRDDKPDISSPNMLDLPGGERDPDEDIETCVLRETFEEIGLSLDLHQLDWRDTDGQDLFFAAHLPAGTESLIVFGPEGQGWELMTPEAFIAHPEAIDRFAAMVRLYLDTRI